LRILKRIYLILICIVNGTGQSGSMSWGNVVQSGVRKYGVLTEGARIPLLRKWCGPGGRVLAVLAVVAAGIYLPIR
jgi:hypothetical protein